MQNNTRAMVDLQRTTWGQIWQRGRRWRRVESPNGQEGCSPAKQLDYITKPLHCTVYEMTIFQQMCFLQSNYIILFWFRQHEIWQCTWWQKARMSLCSYSLQDKNDQKPWILSFEEICKPLDFSSRVPKSTRKKEKTVVGTWGQKSQNQSLQLKIGGKDKEAAVCFKNELFGGKTKSLSNSARWKWLEAKGGQDSQEHTAWQ